MPRTLWLPTLMGVFLTCMGCRAPIPDTPAASSPEGRLYARATVADLHVDPTLWNDDLLVSPDRQAALPQLLAGGVDVAIFGIPSAGLPIIGGWRIFTTWRGYPKEARGDKWQAVLHQISTLQAAAEGSQGRLTLVRDLKGLKAAQASGAVAGFIGVEGAHCLGEDTSRLQELARLGVFYVGLEHLSDDHLGGSNFKVLGRGGHKKLTGEGKQVLREMAEAGLVLDLAHAGRETFFEALELFPGPVMISHTGIGVANPHWRNVDDDQLKAVAARGGVVGIMFGNHYLGGSSIDHWLDHVDHAVKVIGAEHVALGSDFDGMVPLPRGIEGAGDLPRLATALKGRGYSDDDVTLILGGSFVKMLERMEEE